MRRFYQIWVLKLATPLKGVLVFFTVFTATGWLFIQYLPSSGEEHIQVNDDAVDLKWGFKAVAIFSMFAFFVAQGCIWPYLFLIGIDGGVSEQTVANSLMIALLSAIVGAFSIVLMRRRFGRIFPLGVGILGSAAILVTLFGAFSAITYAITVSILNFATGMAHPYLLACMASFDQKGRLITYAVAAQMIGLAAGSTVSASLLGMTGNYSSTLVATISFLLIAYLLILIPLTVHKQQSKGLRQSV